MLPFREITLEDKPMVEHCGSHYNYHLCERCFVDLFMWRSHYFYSGRAISRRYQAAGC